MIGLNGVRRRSSRSAAATLTLVLVVATMSACSSSGDASQSSSTPATASPGTPLTSSTQASSTSAPAGTATGSPADAATTAAVTSAYTKLFAPDTPLAESIAALENGARFKQAIRAQSKSPLATKSSARVSQVTLISPDTAKVTFSILLGGSPVLKNQSGYAVRQDGTWKVADVTFCGLLTMQGSAPAACNAPAATTVPS